LLGEADRADLQVVQGKEDYKYKSPLFQAAIEQALRTANPEGYRSSAPENAKRVEEIFGESTVNAEKIEEPRKIIAPYMAKGEEEEGEESVWYVL